MKMEGRSESTGWKVRQIQCEASPKPVIQWSTSHRCVLEEVGDTAGLGFTEMFLKTNKKSYKF